MATTCTTIAHSVSTATGPTPFTNAQGSITHAPCWNALSGHFLFSSDSPGTQLLRYLVSDSNVFLDNIGVTTLTTRRPTWLFRAACMASSMPALYVEKSGAPSTEPLSFSNRTNAEGRALTAASPRSPRQSTLGSNTVE